MAVVVMIRRNLGSIKEKVLGKLAAASVPADALENSRHFIESAIRDVTVAAHGLTRDALLRIKTHLAELLPPLSPNITRKVRLYLCLRYIWYMFMIMNDTHSLINYFMSFISIYLILYTHTYTYIHTYINNMYGLFFFKGRSNKLYGLNSLIGYCTDFIKL